MAQVALLACTCYQDPVTKPQANHQHATLGNNEVLVVEATPADFLMTVRVARQRIH